MRRLHSFLFIIGVSALSACSPTAPDVASGPTDPARPSADGQPAESARPEDSKSSTEDEGETRAPKSSDLPEDVAVVLKVLLPEHFFATRVNAAGMRTSPLANAAPLDLLFDSLKDSHMSFGAIPDVYLGGVETKTREWDLYSDGDFSWNDRMTVTEYETPDDLQQALDFRTKDGLLQRFSYSGHQYLFREESEEWEESKAMLPLDGRFLCSCDRKLLEKVVDHLGDAADTPLAKQIRQIDPDRHIHWLAWLKPARKGLLALMLEEPPPEDDDVKRVLEASTELVTHIESVNVSFSLDDDDMHELRAVAASPAAAERNVPYFVQVADYFRNVRPASISSPNQQAQDELDAIASEALASLTVKVEGNTIRGVLKRPVQFDRWPALATALDVSEKSQRLDEQGHDVGAAVMAYRREFGEWPTDLRDESGRRLLSWRVAILPQLDDYTRLNLKEPWDSKHNLDEVRYTPWAYDSPHTGRGETAWQWVDGQPAGILIVVSGNGTSVPWTKPDVFTISPNDPLASLGEEPEGGYVIIMMDGSVRRVTAEELVAIIRADE